MFTRAQRSRWLFTMFHSMSPKKSSARQVFKQAATWTLHMSQYYIVLKSKKHPLWTTLCHKSSNHRALMFEMTQLKGWVISGVFFFFLSLSSQWSCPPPLSAAIEKKSRINLLKKKHTKRSPAQSWHMLRMCTCKAFGWKSLNQPDCVVGAVCCYITVKMKNAESVRPLSNLSLHLWLCPHTYCRVKAGNTPQTIQSHT